MGFIFPGNLWPGDLKGGLTNIRLSLFLITFENHFKSSTNALRIISASTLVIFVVIYVASQMDVTGIAFDSILNIDYLWLSMVFALFYFIFF